MITPLASLVLVCSLTAADGTLQLHPENPHYLLYQGKPALLVTSGEHYGAVLNLDFDFIKYLDELSECGLNLTRTFAGTYREVPGSFDIQGNTLAPAPNRYLAPWVKVADARDGLPERFDLDRFEPAYFRRLKAFLQAAADRGVIVELVLFCPNYNDALWAANPMNARNNVNNVGHCPKDEPYTLKHPDLLKRQLAFVRKVVAELNSFDNLYYEICNEPYFGGVTLEWQHRVAETIVEAEKSLPKKHLIAQNIANGQAKVDSLHPAVSILNFHYAEPAAVLDNLKHNRPIADDETGFDGNDDRPYRTEAWLFLLSGGAIFSNLDYSFTPDTEDGSAKVTPPTPGGGGRSLRQQLAFLKTFIEGLDWLRMRPEPDLLPKELPEGVRAAAFVKPKHQYAFYFSGGEQVTVALDLPPSDYTADWIDPRTGQTLETRSIAHPGGKLELRSPNFAEDLALKIEAAVPSTAAARCATTAAPPASSAWWPPNPSRRSQ